MGRSSVDARSACMLRRATPTTCSIQQALQGKQYTASSIWQPATLVVLTAPTDSIAGHAHTVFTHGHTRSPHTVTHGLHTRSHTVSTHGHTRSPHTVTHGLHVLSVQRRTRRTRACVRERETARERCCLDKPGRAHTRHEVDTKDEVDTRHEVDTRRRTIPR